MQWRIGWRAGLALALALTLSACGGAAVRKAPSSPQAKAPSSAQRDSVPRLSGPMRVAVLVPLTGEFASIGQQFVNAATIAVFEDRYERYAGRRKRRRRGGSAGAGGHGDRAAVRPARTGG